MRAWQARKVAQQTRLLSWDAAAEVNAAVAGLIGMLLWPRFRRVLAAALLDADPEQAVERAQRTRTDRDVWAVPTEDGLKLLLARVEHGDAAWFLATVNRIADILAAEGDTDPVGVRRSKAVEILTRPAVALRLLLPHQDDTTTEADSGGDEPADDHQWLDLTGPADLDVSGARPRVVFSFHLNAATVRPRPGPPRGWRGTHRTEFTDWPTRFAVPVQPSGRHPRRLAAVGGVDNPSPAGTGSGPRPDTSTSSPTKAPSRSAAAASPTRSGAAPHPHPPSPPDRQQVEAL